MELIAATRVVKAMQRANAARPYSTKMTGVIEDLAAGGVGADDPLLRVAEKIESMVADKMLDYKMKQKLEMDRQKFEINKTIAIEQKNDERHKENKKEKEKANEKAFKLKEQEIKLNERQHKENLDQQKNIANNQARQKQQEFDQKEMENRKN